MNEALLHVIVAYFKEFVYKEKALTCIVHYHVHTTHVSHFFQCTKDKVRTLLYEVKIVIAIAKNYYTMCYYNLKLVLVWRLCEIFNIHVEM